MTTEREAFEAWCDKSASFEQIPTVAPFAGQYRSIVTQARWEAWQAACAWQRERDAEKAGEYAKQWWSKHCATNKHMETTRSAHDDFCALQNKIRSNSCLNNLSLSSASQLP